MEISLKGRFSKFENHRKVKMFTSKLIFRVLNFKIETFHVARKRKQSNSLKFR